MTKDISYFTHLIGLWMGNDKGTHDDMKEIAQSPCVADALRCYFEDRMPSADGFANDMIEAALDHVDWDFLADELMEENRNV